MICAPEVDVQNKTMHAPVMSVLSFPRREGILNRVGEQNPYEYAKAFLAHMPGLVRIKVRVRVPYSYSYHSHVVAVIGTNFGSNATTMNE